MQYRSPPLLESLEPRLLYSADDPAALLGALHADAHDAAVATGGSVAEEIVFIDRSIPGSEQLALDLERQAAHGRPVRVEWIEAGDDAIGRIGDVLEAASGRVAAVHLIGHGTTGALMLGGSELDTQATLVEAERIAAWGRHLAPGADLLLYGCDSGAGAAGGAFVDALARLTGADVAASDDRTGHTLLGGDWTLEVRRGAVEARVAISTLGQTQWNGVLATYTVTNANDSGAGSLRQAIIDANNSAGADTISFDIAPFGAQVITLGSALPDITGTVTIDGTTQAGFAANGSKPVLVIDGAGLSIDGLRLTASADGSTIRGLVIRNVGGDGIYIDAGSDGNLIAGNFIGAFGTTGANAAGAGIGGTAVFVGGANNTVGGTTTADRNVIAAAGTDVRIYGSDATGNLVSGNYIGTDATGNTLAAGSAHGVLVDSGASANSVGGSTAASRNIIAGGTAGIRITGAASDGNTVSNNWIGLGADGATLLGNQQRGVLIDGGASYNTIGGAGMGNVIVASGYAGVQINGDGTPSNDNRVLGNFIGTDAGGTLNGGNAEQGVLVWGNASRNQIGGVAAGMGNVIAYNGKGGTVLNGVQVYSGVDTVSILGNSIYSNSGLGIELGDAGNGVTANDAGDADGGANNLQNFPVLTRANTNGSSVHISGTLNTLANSDYRIEFFASASGDASGHGEGQRYLGAVNVLTNGSGNAAFDVTLAAAVAAGEAVTATATLSNAAYSYYWDSSEFAQNVTAAAVAITSNGGGASAALSLAETNTAVTTVAASGGGITYSIVGGADAGRFTINASTGALSFITAPDYEAPTDAGANRVYDVTVQASDGVFSDTQAIAISVTAVNEAAPVITSNGGGSNASLSVAENLTAVTSVTATDADLPAPTLSYSIAGGADAATFSINASSGALAFISAPNYEAPTDAGANNVYDVIVRASDGTLADLQTLAVTVTPVNDNAPSMTSASAVNVAENSTAVTTLAATDADLPAQTLTFSIVGGADAGAFTVDAATGALRFVAAPDFEAPADADHDNVYQVTVQASDGTYAGTRAMTVSVTPVNESAPVITSNGGGAGASISVAENTAGAVTTVTATDADLPAAALSYSISGGADAARFTIDAATGMLRFATAPDVDDPADAGADNVYNVTVRVSDGTNADTQALAITVTPVNDNAPIITSNGGGASATVDVDERVTAVTSVAATDADRPPQTLTYSVAGGADAAFFTIDGTTGELRFAAAPDFENPLDADADNVYQVIVHAGDGTLTDTQALSVTVRPVNDNAPVIASDGGGASASISVSENDTTATDVQASDADRPAQALAYSIAGGADAARFTIDALSGVLRFAAAPDYENPLDADADNVYEVLVRAGDGTGADTQALSITVLDTNDNDPVITSNGGGTTAAVGVAENSTAVTTVTASDIDTPTLVYDIAGGADAALFTIDASTGALSFVAAPDFESPADAGANNVYNVIVRVSDGNAGDTQTIAVTVTPVNDNAPAITSDGAGASATIDVAENTTAVTTVAAADADRPAQTLTYSIVGGADAALFSIDAATGVLRFAAAPDYELALDADGDNVYDVIVRASDGSYTDTQALSVSVTPLDDNTPAITSDGAGPSATIDVAENTTAVTTVAAADADRPAQTLTYSIAGGADAALFSIDAATGTLRFVAAPDFENPLDTDADNLYHVFVRASDGAQADTQTIAVRVTPVPEHTPQITSNGGGASAAVDVAENQTAVTTVVATDADLPVPTLSYAIDGGSDAARFAIDASTGRLSFVAAPDHENPLDADADNVYHVIVLVSDGGAGTTQAITVTVTPVNDNAPVITSDGGGANAAVSIAENSTAVTTLTAADADQPTPPLSYAIVGGADAHRFVIDAARGALRFVAAPDYELPDDAGADGVYHVVVQVSDGARSATQAIAVTVTPVNDNPPTITSDGGGAGATVEVAENGTAVTTLTAFDADLPTPTLTFAIAGGADAARFAIDAVTGELRFVAAPDYENPADADADNVYDVTVEVRHGSERDTQALQVRVTPVDEQAPRITSDAAASVAENTQAVLTVQAADDDLPLQPLTYSIAGGADAGWFTIDAASGALRFVAAPDHEAPLDADGDNVYAVVVHVSDGSGGDTQAIRVTVTPVNDNVPAFTSPAGASVDENKAAVVTVAASDADRPAQTLSYSIAGGADAARFTIDAATGALRFVTAPDYEAPLDADADNVYRVIVRASDGSASTLQAIAVTVRPVNDNAPLITNDGGGASATLDVAENSTAVTTVTAVDADRPGQALVYSIAGGADAQRFTIDAATGSLRFVAAPDHENPADADANNVYHVTVRVSDGTRFADQAVSVTVTPVSDNAPMVTSGPSAVVAENTTTVLTVTATDADSPAQALTYSIAGGADAARFAIDPSTGVLSFVAAPDAENPLDAGADNVYHVTVRVSDGALFADQAIVVTVTPADDNAPVVTSRSTTNVAENSTAVLTVTATDADLPAQTLAYAIVGGADAARFTIDPGTGALSFAAAPDHENPADAGGDNVYHVTVRAGDGARYVDQAIAVTVTPVDDNAPAITSNGGGASASVSVAENGTAVTTVSAVDADLPASSLTYGIIGGADAARFTIDAATGALRFVAPPDRERARDADADNVYEVDVQAGDGVHTTLQQLRVTITDVNDNPPRFVEGSGELQLTIGAGSTHVLKLRAVDADEAPRLAYRIAGGADASALAIDAATGELRLRAPATAGTRYEVVVEVDDGGHVEALALRVTVAADAPADATPPASAPPAPPPPVAPAPPPSIEPAGVPEAALAPASAAPGATPSPGIDYAIGAPPELAVLSLQHAAERPAQDGGDAGSAIDVAPAPLPRAAAGTGSAGDAGARQDTARVDLDEPLQGLDAALPDEARVAVLGGLTTGAALLLWAGRGTALLAGLAATAPAWKRYDIFPVLRRGAAEDSGAEDDNADTTGVSRDRVFRIEAETADRP